MRVVLVGPLPARQRLRARLGPGIEVIAEAPSVAAARDLPVDADALLLPPSAAAEVDGTAERLTPRESEVLDLVADGLSNKAVASRLGISDETVKFHLAAIFGKLGASNRTDAVRQALRRGLLTL